MQFLLSLVLAACSGSDQGTPVPDLHAEMYFKGASRNDFWAATGEGLYGIGSGVGGIAHFDGSGWKIIDPSPLPFMSYLEPADDGKVWILGNDMTAQNTVGAPRLIRFAANGTIEDFTSSLTPLDYTRARLFRRAGNTVVMSGGYTTNTGNVPWQMFWFDGSAFVALPPLPAELRELAGAAPFAADNIYVDAAIYDPTAGRLKPVLVHWNGSTWQQLPLTGYDLNLGLAKSPPTAPANDVWVDCGPRATRFDGQQLVPVQLPIQGLCWFAYDGAHRIVYEYQGTSADPGSAQACDIYGNCQPIDTYTTVSTNWRTATWNGSAWTDDHAVASVESCAGAACAYGAARRRGVAGFLEDGTAVFVGSIEGVEHYWLVGD